MYVWLISNKPDVKLYRRVSVVRVVPSTTCVLGQQVHHAHTYALKSSLNHRDTIIYITKDQKVGMPTSPSVPKRSPIQVLTGLERIWLQWSDENWYICVDMNVAEQTRSIPIYMVPTTILLFNYYIPIGVHLITLHHPHTPSIQIKANLNLQINYPI